MAYIKEFIHNVVVHPLMMVLPSKYATKMHDINATWVFGLNKYDEININQKSTVDRLRLAMLLIRVERSDSSSTVDF